jgi:toxin YoeB
MVCHQITKNAKTKGLTPFMSYELVYTRQARKDAKKLKGTTLAKKAKELLEIIQEDPFADASIFP